MSAEDVVAIENVVAVSDGLALICEVGGGRVGVPLHAIDITSQVRKVGDRGTLVITREAAVNLRLA